MCMWGTVCFSWYKTTSWIIHRLVSATGTALKQPCFAQLMLPDFWYAPPLHFWHLRTCLPFSVAWHSHLKLHVPPLFLVFLLYSLTLFIAVQLQDVFSIGSLFSPLNFACESTWPPSSRKKKKVARKHHQQHCFSVNSIQICAICIIMY